MATALLIFGQQYAYADKGDTVKFPCNYNASCPPGQSGSASFTMQLYSKYHVDRCNAAKSYFDQKLAEGWGSADIRYRLEKDYAAGAAAKVSISCVNNGPAYQSTKTESRTSACPSAQPIGSILESRTYEVWSDGSIKNYSAWVTSSSTCKAIPTTQTTTTTSSQTVSCDAYYNAPVGTYSGTVIKYGNDVTTYSSVTMTTSTVFNPTGNIDTTGCNNTNGDVEYKNEACDAGQTGIKVLYSYVTTVNGVKSYSPWEVFSSTCQASDNSDANTPEAFKQEASLISNMSVTSSDLINNSSYNNFLSKIKSESWTAEENHTLNIVIDDASKNVYNPSKLTDSVNAFKNAVGANYTQVKIVSVPKDLSKYKGYEGLSDTTNKAFKSATVNSNNVIVLEYLDFSKKDNNGLPKKQTVNIPIFTSSMGGGIKSNDK